MALVWVRLPVHARRHVRTHPMLVSVRLPVLFRTHPMLVWVLLPVLVRTHPRPVCVGLPVLVRTHLILVWVRYTYARSGPFASACSYSPYAALGPFASACSYSLSSRSGYDVPTVAEVNDQAVG